jgi:NTE family protein
LYWGEALPKVLPMGSYTCLGAGKIPIHMIVGTSVGSLIGAIYASNPDSFELEWKAFKIERNDVLDPSLIYSKFGPVRGYGSKTSLTRL